MLHDISSCFCLPGFLIFPRSFSRCWAKWFRTYISVLWQHTARKTIFSFSRRPEKMVFPKNRAGIWSFSHYWERSCFFFPKIWSYTLDGKWKMIFLKKYTEIWYFLQALLKDGHCKRDRAGTWSFLYYLKRWYFFLENVIFFPWAESEGLSSSGNTWKHDASPSEEKQGSWYIWSRFGPSLNLFIWRYSTMNNL